MGACALRRPSQLHAAPRCPTQPYPTHLATSGGKRAQAYTHVHTNACARPCSQSMQASVVVNTDHPLCLPLAAACCMCVKVCMCVHAGVGLDHGSPCALTCPPPHVSPVHACRLAPPITHPLLRVPCPRAQDLGPKPLHALKHPPRHHA